MSLKDQIGTIRQIPFKGFSQEQLDAGAIPGWAHFVPIASRDPLEDQTADLLGDLSA